MKLLDILNAPWAILPASKREIDAIYATHLRGEKIDLKAIEATLGRPLNNPKTTYEVVNGVAVLDITGVIAKKMNLFTAISGGVSTEILAQAFQKALADPLVQSILLVIDSPGGSVDGPPALANAIFAARGQKPIVTLADGMMASAAYWIGAGAHRMYAASRTTMVGSIGVVATHVDVSGLEALQGVKTTEIVSGKFKRIASQYGPLSVEGRQSIQDQTDVLYSVFLDALVQFLGAASSEDLHATMADGRTCFADQAMSLGMVDGLATLDELLARMADGEFNDLPTDNSTGATRAVSRVAPAKILTAAARTAAATMVCNCACDCGDSCAGETSCTCTCCDDSCTCPPGCTCCPCCQGLCACTEHPATRAVSRARSLSAAAGAAARPEPTTTLTHEDLMAKDNDSITAEQAKPHVDAALAIARTEFEGKTKEERKAAADGERGRIKSILDLDKKLPGHRARLETLAFDGTADRATVLEALVEAEGEKKVKLAAALRADAPNAAAHTVSTETGTPEKGNETAVEKKTDENASMAKAVADAGKARKFIAEQAKLGFTVSAAEAVAHVTAEEAK